MSMPEACWLAREITTHRKGRGDNEHVTVEALTPGTYRVSVPKATMTPSGPDAPPKPCAPHPANLIPSGLLHQTVLEFKSAETDGLTDEALLAILVDRMRLRDQADATAKKVTYHLEDALNLLRANGS